MIRAHDILSALPPLLTRGTGRVRTAAADTPPAGCEGGANRPDVGLAAEDRLFATGFPDLDAALAGGLKRGALHEIMPAADADGLAAAGFALGLALRAARDEGGRALPLLVIQQEAVEAELGWLHGAGLAAFGADPGRITFVRVADQVAGLRAMREALRCAALGAVLVQFRGGSSALDLTATRRLTLTSAETGVPLLFVRHAAGTAPSAAATRWQIAAAPSRALEADAPGHPSFAVTLTRNRAGLPERTWQMEWACDRLTFADPADLAGSRATPLFGPVVPPAVLRAAAA